MFSLLLESRASAYCNGYLRKRMPQPWVFTVPAPFSQLLLLTIMSHGMEYAFGHLGSTLLAVFPFQLLAHPSLFTGGGRVEKREKLNAVQALVSNRKTLVCYQYCLSHKSKIQQYTNSYEENHLPSQIQSAANMFGECKLVTWFGSQYCKDSFSVFYYMMSSMTSPGCPQAFQWREDI